MDEAQTRLIVMLTHHDRTVENAPEVFEACRGTGAEYWGMKEEGLPPGSTACCCARGRCSPSGTP